jgi:hypothetical protein
VATEDNPWIEVLGKAAAYLCLAQVAKDDPRRVPDVVGKVQFLEGLGIPTADAAQMLGTTANSIKTNLRERARRTGGTRAKRRK